MKYIPVYLRHTTYAVFQFLIIFVISCTYAHAQVYQDCEDPFPICEFQTYHFPSMEGFGLQEESFDRLKCSTTFNESNSIWLEFAVSESGVLTFAINPVVTDDDLDFVLFKKSKDCSDLAELRCMASGNNYGGSTAKDSPCQGRTGLSVDALDEFEESGCKYNDDNFLKYLSVTPNERYMLLINNYESNEGFSISFDGNCTLKDIAGCWATDLAENVLVTDLYPNPSADYITLEYITTQDSDIKFEILDISGRSLQSLFSSPLQGFNRQTFELSDFPSGTYLIRVTQDGFSTVKQFLIK